MAALDDLSQKIIVVVLFTSVFVVIWLIVRQRGSLGPKYRRPRSYYPC
jgi:hypothetical protein